MPPRIFFESYNLWKMVLRNIIISTLDNYIILTQAGQMEGSVIQLVSQIVIIPILPGDLKGSQVMLYN